MRLFASLSRARPGACLSSNDRKPNKVTGATAGRRRPGRPGTSRAARVGRFGRSAATPMQDKRHSRMTPLLQPRFRKRICAIAAAFGLWGGAACGQNLLTNASFELPGAVGTSFGYCYFSGGSDGIPGWMTLLNGVEYLDPSQSPDGKQQYYLGVAQDGSYCVDLPPLSYTGGGIQQTFPTLVGQPYEVSFFMGTFVYNGRVGTGSLTVSAGDRTNSFAVTNLTGFVQWAGQSFVFTALSNLTTLTFTTSDNPLLHFCEIDNVSVVPLLTSNALWLALDRYPGIHIAGETGRTYLVQYCEPPSTNLQQMQYVTLPTASNLVFDVSSPGRITRQYRAFELPAPQTIGQEVATTVAGLLPGVKIRGRAGQACTLQYRDSLSGTNWVALTNLVLSTSSAMVFDPGSLGMERRFYRARSP